LRIAGQSDWVGSQQVAELCHGAIVPVRARGAARGPEVDKLPRETTALVTKKRTAPRMSNPSGPDQDVPQAQEESAEEEPQATEAISTSEPEPEPEFESAEPTEVIAGSEPPAEEPEERRYSAPSGFDVMSTEKIENTPDPVTEVIPPTATQSPRTATPQAIPPHPGRHRSWGLVAALIFAIAVLATVTALAIIWVTHTKAVSVSQEDMVRQTIQDFDTAIQKGDLAQLRGITCGSTRDSYVNYRDADWAATHARVAAAKQYPVVASIDQVVVNDQHAEANVTTFMAYAPQVRSTRSFDLQFLDGRWKICEGPLS
jgi:hypothetical protein